MQKLLFETAISWPVLLQVSPTLSAGLVKPRGASRGAADKGIMTKVQSTRVRAVGLCDSCD